MHGGGTTDSVSPCRSRTLPGRRWRRAAGAVSVLPRWARRGEFTQGRNIFSRAPHPTLELFPISRWNGHQPMVEHIDFRRFQSLAPDEITYIGARLRSSDLKQFTLVGANPDADRGLT